MLSNIENYSEAYPDFFPDWNQNSVIDLLETQEAGLSGLDLVWNNRIGWKRKMKTFLSGPYVEFYQGGQIRTEGYYRILEVFSNADTTLIFNPETYEDEMIITNGEFWFPRSFKYGTWKFYNPNGTIRKKRHYNVPTNGNAIRLLELGSLTSKDY